MAKPKVEPVQEPVDKQKEYLVDKFGGLIKQIGDGYGQPLQEELIRRLEKTISDFHEEVEELLENLKNRSAEREERLKELLEKAAMPDEPVEPEPGDGEPEPDLSEWEKRLERKSQNDKDTGNGKEEPEAVEDRGKKKGFFKKSK